jgi:hypothetical protein
MTEAKPIEVLENTVDKFWTAAARIEILDPEQEFPPVISCGGMAKRRRESVPKMKPSGRRGGETCDLQDSLHGKGDRGDS